jgi:hypothetical protein
MNFDKCIPDDRKQIFTDLRSKICILGVNSKQTIESVDEQAKIISLKPNTHSSLQEENQNNLKSFA